MEKMFDLLEEDIDVKDKEGAPDLVVTEGRVEFKSVSFSYSPEKEILHDISFTIEPGMYGDAPNTKIHILYRRDGCNCGRFRRWKIYY